MKDFAAGPGRLRTLSLGAKILYTAFIVSALSGLGVSYRLYGAVVGESGAAAYYAGATPTATAKVDAPSGGPELDLPDDVKKPQPITELVSDRKLLEVTHFHLFSVPVYVLILAHLWLLARLPGWAHTAGIVGSVATSGFHLAAPWLVRGRPGSTVLMPVSGVAMLVCLAVVAIVPAIDMWLPPRRAAKPEG